MANLLKETKKSKSKEKKARQRSRKVLCHCKLCKGTSEISIRTARKHLKLYGLFEITSNNDDSLPLVIDEAGPLKLTEGNFDELELAQDDFEAFNSVSSSFQENPESYVDYTLSSDDEEECVAGTEHVKSISKNVGYDEEVYEKALYDTDRAKIPLYTNSDQTVLQTLCRYFSWFSEHPGVSKSSLSDLLSLQHNYVLPANNNLPSSYDDALKFIQPFLLPLKTYHVCPNHCVVYRDGPRFNYKNLTKCPECGMDRYFGNKQPRNCFHYYPVGPRWRRMYGDATISELLQGHRMPSYSGDEGGVIRDIHDSPQFLEAFNNNGVFGGDPRGLALQFSTDGMNPFSHGTYSMWPLTLTMLNLPKKVRHLFSSIMLVGIVPGQQSDCALKIDAYLEILVDELCELSGVQFYDSFHNESFSFKVMVLNHVLDYPGLNKLFSAFGANAIQACMWCEIEGTYVDSLDKTVYLGNRRYLPIDSDLRLDKEHFPEKSVEKREPPCKRKFTDIMIDSLAYENAPNATQARNIARGSGVKFCYSLMLLPGHDRTTQAFPDIMHASKNVVLAILDLITGREDTDKVRKTESTLQRFTVQSNVNQVGTTSKGNCSNARVSGNKRKASNANKQLPDAPFRLTKDEMKKADKRAFEISVPVGFGWKPKSFFSNYTHMKTHDWKEVSTQGIIKYCLKDALGSNQRATFFALLDFLRKLHADEQSNESIKELRLEINEICARIERDFPVSVQVISLHILRHIVDGIEIQGPTHSWSMWMYERFNSWISRRVMNRKTPEATIMKTYQVYDWCQYMKMSGKLPSEESPSFKFDVKPDVYDIDDDDEFSRANTSVVTKSIPAPDNIVIALKKFYEISDDDDQDFCNEISISHSHHEILCGRVVEWRGKEKEKSSVSSVIEIKLEAAMRNNTTPTFGQIMHFFNHRYGDLSTKFAVVEMFLSKYTDKTSENQWRVTLQRSRRVVIPAKLEYFSLPLVTAKPADNKDVLYILNN